MAQRKIYSLFKRNSLSCVNCEFCACNIDYHHGQKWQDAIEPQTSGAWNLNLNLQSSDFEIFDRRLLNLTIPSSQPLEVEDLEVEGGSLRKGRSFVFELSALGWNAPLVIRVCLHSCFGSCFGHVLTIDHIDPRASAMNMFEALKEMVPVYNVRSGTGDKPALSVFDLS